MAENNLGVTRENKTRAFYIIKRRATLSFRVAPVMQIGRSKGKFDAISQMCHLFRAGEISNKRNFNYFDRARDRRIRARNSV